MATQSRVLAWRIPWTKTPGRLQSIDHKESEMTEWLTLSLSTLFTSTVLYTSVYIVSSPYNIHHMKLTSYSIVQFLHHFFRYSFSKDFLTAPLVKLIIIITIICWGCLFYFHYLAVNSSGSAQLFHPCVSSFKHHSWYILSAKLKRKNQLSYLLCRSCLIDL